MTFRPSRWRPGHPALRRLVAGHLPPCAEPPLALEQRRRPRRCLSGPPFDLGVGGVPRRRVARHHLFSFAPGRRPGVALRLRAHASRPHRHTHDGPGAESSPGTPAGPLPGWIPGFGHPCLPTGCPRRVVSPRGAPHGGHSIGVSALRYPLTDKISPARSQRSSRVVTSPPSPTAPGPCRVVGTRGRCRLCSPRPGRAKLGARASRRVCGRVQRHPCDVPSQSATRAVPSRWRRVWASDDGELLVPYLVVVLRGAATRSH